MHALRSPTHALLPSPRLPLHEQKADLEVTLAEITEDYSQGASVVRTARRKAEEREAEIAQKQARIRQLQERCVRRAARVHVAAHRRPMGVVSQRQQGALPDRASSSRENVKPER